MPDFHIIMLLEKDMEDDTYENALGFGVEIGIIDETVDTDNFLRADMVIISFNSLFANLKDSEKTLSQKLQEDGVFTAEDEYYYDKVSLYARRYCRPLIPTA